MKTRDVSNEEAIEVNQRALSSVMERQSGIQSKQTFLVGAFKDIFSASSNSSRKKIAKVENNKQGFLTR